MELTPIQNAIINASLYMSYLYGRVSEKYNLDCIPPPVEETDMVFSVADDEANLKHIKEVIVQLNNFLVGKYKRVKVLNFIQNLGNGS